MFDADMVAMVDTRIAQARSATNAVGVMVTRTTTSDALVIFDGSQGPIPVKISGDVTVYENDRVLMTKYGSWWVITAAMSYRGTKRLTVASKAIRQALTNLAYGDEVTQQDTSVSYWWNGTQWVVKGGSSVYSWVKGPLVGSSNSRIIIAATSQVSVKVTPTVELESANLYLFFWSLQCASGVAGNHFFHSRIKNGAGGTQFGESGELTYAGTFDPVRSSATAMPYVTGASEGSAVFELTIADNSGLQYDVYGDTDDPAYLHIVGGGRAASTLDTT
jgi:hypothetical protein